MAQAPGFCAHCGEPQPLRGGRFCVQCGYGLVALAGDRQKDTLRINYGPLRRVAANTGRSMAIGAGVAGVSLVQVVGVAFAVLFAALVWWLSDLAYSMTWLLGFPLRLVAIVVGFGALFAVIGGALYIAGIIVFGLFAMAKGALGGKSLDE